VTLPFSSKPLSLSLSILSLVSDSEEEQQNMGQIQLNIAKNLRVICWNFGETTGENQTKIEEGEL